MESRLFAYGGTWAGKDVFDYVAMFLMVAHTGEDGRGFDDVVIYSGNWAAACPRIGFKGQIGISYQPPLSTASEKTTERRTTWGDRFTFDIKTPFFTFQPPSTLLRSIIKFEHIYNRAIHPCVMNLAQSNTMLVANSTMFPMRLEIVSIKWVQDPGQLGTPANSHFYV